MESLLKRMINTLMRHKKLAIKTSLCLALSSVVFLAVASTNAANAPDIDALEDNGKTASVEMFESAEETECSTVSETTSIEVRETTTLATTVVTTEQTTTETTETTEEIQMTETSTIDETTESDESETICCPAGTILDSHLTSSGGTSNAPNGFLETWYDLDMSGVVAEMRRQGFSESEYPYWINPETGTKMLGNYVMVAADIDQVYFYKFGDLVETDLGTGIVCDTGGFRFENPEKYDIAVNWKHDYYPGYND